jgi:hypothetical protein
MSYKPAGVRLPVILRVGFGKLQTRLPESYAESN